MTKLLEKAIATVGELSDKDQDAVAAIILEELASEKRWTKTFSKSQEQLALLAKETLEEFNRGETTPL